ncbi:hypothetical protein [Maricaulis sp. MIT060901]|uniref:hypothetical protein n=1 Tax=Maricaulis sp. MIT060901 TaxID=3096993 RepID=UPI00399A2486
MDYSLPANDKATSTLYALGIGNGASSETVGIGFTNTATNRLLVVAGGSTGINASSALRPNSQEQRIAVRLAQGDAYFAASGEVGRSYALPAMPSGADTVFLGRYPNGGGAANVLFVKSFRYFPATLSNTELEALVA